MANAGRVRDVAEAFRYGSLLGCDLEEVANSVEGGMTVVAAPTGVFSILGRVQGRSQGQPLRGLAGAEPPYRGDPRSVPLTALARRSS